jgi:DNA-binding response OmpR family regulator
MSTVLVVEDDRVMLDLLVLALRKKGHEVWPAESVTSALRAWKQHRPTIVVLDILLPNDNDGIRLLQQARRLHLLRNTRVVVVSCVAEKCHASLNGLGVKAQDVYAKPFSVNTVASRI